MQRENKAVTISCPRLFERVGTDCEGRVRTGIITLMGTPPTIEVASIGMADSMILMILALVVFGPRRLPQIGRQIGKLMYEFRKASNDFKFQMEEELRNAEEADRRKREDAERERRLALEPPAPEPESYSDAVESYSEMDEEGYGASSETEGADADVPYTYDSDYNEVPMTEAEAASSVGHVEESHLRVQPPSTGETVPAERPGSAVAAPEAEVAAPLAGTTVGCDSASAATGDAVSAEGPEPAAVPAPRPKRTRTRKKKTEVKETSAATEPATHNG